MAANAWSGGQRRRLPLTSGDGLEAGSAPGSDERQAAVVAALGKGRRRRIGEGGREETGGEVILFRREKKGENKIGWRKR